MAPPAGGALSHVRPDEIFERVERLRDDLGHIKERWDNRLVLENSSLWECYLDGRAEIVLYGNWGWGLNELKWAIRVPACRAAFEGTAAAPGVDVIDLHDGDGWHEIIVFVEVAKAGCCPKMEVRVPARLYVFEDKFRSVGEGLLYSRVGRGGFQVFPFFRKREVDISSGFAGHPDDGNHPVIERLPKIIHGVAYDRAKMICDRLFGPVGEAKTIRLSKGRNGVAGAYVYGVEVFGEGGRVTDNMVNVAIGPFDL